MSTEEPPFSSTKSLLDKPLHQLTEDDISQLTREDCRRYLKQKGMRRPSWNKSQAIQQVIMLKTLLEPAADSETGSRKLYITPRQQQTPATHVQKGTSADTEISVSAEESVPGQCTDAADKSDLPDANPAHLVATDNDSVPPGITGVTDEAKGQMTIFYSGKVNVYDDVPADKARVLLQLAASPLCFPQEDLHDGNSTMGPLPCHLQAPTTKLSQESSAMLLPTMQTVRMTDNSRRQREESNVFREDNSAEGSASRKASVQRYLEKRKDRFKSKRKPGAPACGSSDVFFSHQTGNQNLSEQSSRSDTCSPPPVRPPNTPNRFS